MMRRPLFVVSACLVGLTAIRLNFGWLEERNLDSGVGEIYDNAIVQVTGQVYRKDEESIYIKDVVFNNYENFESSTESIRSINSAVDPQRPFSNLICEINTAEGQKQPQMISCENIPLGCNVTISGRFTPFFHARNPGEFDAAVYYRSLRICGKIRDGKLISIEGTSWRIQEWLYQRSRQLSERLYLALPQQYAAILEAMLLGEQDNIERDIKDLYRRNGILHILSISGMHVSIIGMSIHKFLRRLGLPMQVAAIGGGFVLLAYGALTGFGLSAVRAIGMYLIRMLGEAVGRTYDMLTAVGLVACCMVLQNPYYLQNSGFLLSFSCVLGVGMIYPVLLPEIRRYQGNNRPAVTMPQKVMGFLRQAELPRKTVESFFLSLSVTLATLPVQLCLYYEVPTFSVFLNLFIVPLLEPLMLSGIVTMIIPSNVLLKAVVCAIFDAYEFMCRCFDVLPLQTWNPGCPNVWQVVIYYLVLFAVIGWKKRQKDKDWERQTESRAKGQAIGQMNCLLFLLAAICILSIHPRGISTVSFLDVGQGSCVLLQLSSGESYLFDCGSTSRKNVGQYVLLPYLKHEGIRNLDGVFVSHSDTDHVSGIIELLELCKDNDIVIKQLILPDVEDSAKKEEFRELYERMEDIQICYISAGDRWECKGAKFLCLHPSEKYSAVDANQYSQCMLVEFLHEDKVTSTLLLTGDVGGEGEKDFMQALNKYDKGNVTVYQCAHHGSKHSNSEELLEVLQPKLTLISAGKDNGYGHPHQETLERLEAVNSRVFSTVDCGMLQVKMGRRVRVYRFLRE